jgi:hypothetical protein
MLAGRPGADKSVGIAHTQPHVEAARAGQRQVDLAAFDLPLLDEAREAASRAS